VPNMADVTWDVPMRDVGLVVGNETGSDLKNTSLADYLATLKLNAAARDTHVIVSAQCCYLPVVRGATTEFHVALYNYASRADDPAVLVLVCSAAGTSAQTVSGVQEMYFNAAGKRCPFTAERITDERARRGVSISGDMTADEAQRNCLVIVQVPLRLRVEPVFQTKGVGKQTRSWNFGTTRAAQRAADNTEHAMISAGRAAGDFPPLSREITRDARYPVRVTLQFYMATDNGVISAESMAKVAEQLRAARGAFPASSLVLDGNTGRPMESRAEEEEVKGAVAAAVLGIALLVTFAVLPVREAVFVIVFGSVMSRVIAYITGREE